MPVSITVIIRLAVLIALALHVFYMYCLARTFDNSVGFHVAVTIIAALFALAMLVPLVWAVTLPDLAEIYVKNVRGRRWWKRGRCPQCGYAVSHSVSSSCPECGSAFEQPKGYKPTWNTVRRYIVINLLAWAAGCVLGETWTLADEREFAREVQAITASAPDTTYVRSRRWPSGSRLLSSESRHVETTKGQESIPSEGGS